MIFLVLGLLLSGIATVVLAEGVPFEYPNHFDNGSRRIVNILKSNHQYYGNICSADPAKKYALTGCERMVFNFAYLVRKKDVTKRDVFEYLTKDSIDFGSDTNPIDPVEQEKAINLRNEKLYDAIKADQAVEASKEGASENAPQGQAAEAQAATPTPAAPNN